jgi:SepF-like predicted cell division protein (DUF552 family)
MALEKIKKLFSGQKNEADNEYLEIDVTEEEKQNKVVVKLFVLKQYEEVNDVLTALREGYTITILDIKELRKKDPIELKRSIGKIKKTADAVNGNIAGFGENMIIVTSSFAKIHKEVSPVKKEERKMEDLY